MKAIKVITHLAKYKLISQRVNKLRIKLKETEGISHSKYMILRVNVREQDLPRMSTSIFKSITVTPQMKILD